MKEYVLHILNNKQYSALILCLSHENIFTFYEELQHEPFIREKAGIILLDQLLVTGNGENRYVTIPFDAGKIDFSRAKNEIVNPVICKLSVKLLCDNVSSLKNTILTDVQQERIRQKIS